MKIPFRMSLPKFRKASLSVRGFKNMERFAPEAAPYLRAGEKVISVVNCNVEEPGTLENYESELARLCGVETAEDIGTAGPAKTAMPVKGRENDVSQGLYECRFGRDGLFAAGDLMGSFPALTRTTLMDYASFIGMIDDVKREELFGKMFHEARDLATDPLARKISKEQGWDWPYYGSADATPLFVNVLLNYCLKIGSDILDENYTGRDGNVYKIRDALGFSLKFIISRLNANKEYFLEYRSGFKGSIDNQAMEDSYDSHFYEDGRLPNFGRGVASAEIQGQAYDSLVLAAYCYDKFELGRKSESNYFRHLAGELKKSMIKHLWVEDDKGGYFAVGTGRDEYGRVKTMRARKAIPFFILNTMLLSKQDPAESEMIKRSADTLFSPELLAAGGIRGLAYDEPRFMPGAYHNGSVWLFQTFQIAEGLRRHGYGDLAKDLDDRVVRAVESVKYYPEYVRGDKEDVIRVNKKIIDTFDKEDGMANRREQPPQQVQLWTLTAYAAIMHRRKAKVKPLMSEVLEEVLASKGGL
jgi:glycogen debranching enzyme